MIPTPTIYGPAASVSSRKDQVRSGFVGYERFYQRARTRRRGYPLGIAVSDFRTAARGIDRPRKRWVVTVRTVVSEAFRDLQNAQLLKLTEYDNLAIPGRKRLGSLHSGVALLKT